MNISVSTLVVVASFGLALFAFVMGAIRNLKKDLIKYLDDLSTRVGRLEDRVGRLEDRIGRLEIRVDKIQSSINQLYILLAGVLAKQGVEFPREILLQAAAELSTVEDANVAGPSSATSEPQPVAG